MYKFHSEYEGLCWRWIRSEPRMCWKILRPKNISMRNVETLLIQNWSLVKGKYLLSNSLSLLYTLLLIFTATWRDWAVWTDGTAWWNGAAWRDEAVLRNRALWSNGAGWRNGAIEDGNIAVRWYVVFKDIVL